MFGEDASSAGAESGEGALQIALARLLPALLKSQVTDQSGAEKSSACHISYTNTRLIGCCIRPERGRSLLRYTLEDVVKPTRSFGYMNACIVSAKTIAASIAAALACRHLWTSTPVPLSLPQENRAAILPRMRTMPGTA